MSTQNNTTQLPFPPLGEVLSRNKAREYKTGFAEEALYIPWHMIRLRPGFNWRKPAPYQTYDDWMIQLGLEELAEGILANNGPEDPIVGDMVMEDGGPVFYINEGQRRWMAIGLLINVKNVESYPNGKSVNQVLVRRNPTDMSDFDRVKKIHTSQSKMPLKPSEIAAGFKMVKTCFLKQDGTQYTDEEIGAAYGVSRQTVGNMLKVADLAPEMLQQLDNKEISLNAAIAGTRKPRKIVPVDEDTGEIIAGADAPEGQEALVAKLLENMGWDDHVEGFDYEIAAGGIRLIHDGTFHPFITGVSKQHITETKLADDAEMLSRVTSPKTTNQLQEKLREDRKEADDSMSIDFTPDKIQGEFIVNEAVKNQDKIRTILKNFPGHLKQYVQDINQLLDWNETKFIELGDILKKASDRR